MIARAILLFFTVIARLCECVNRGNPLFFKSLESLRILYFFAWILWNRRKILLFSCYFMRLLESFCSFASLWIASGYALAMTKEEDFLANGERA